MIQIADNISYQGPKPNFARDLYKDRGALKLVTDSQIDDGHIAYCSETGLHYEYKYTNSEDVVTGKWREYKSIDAALSATSENAVQNKVIQAAITDLLDKYESVKGEVDNIEFDSELNETSINGVQNKVIKARFDEIGVQIATIINDYATKEELKAATDRLDSIDANDLPKLSEIFEWYQELTQGGEGEGGGLIDPETSAKLDELLQWYEDQKSSGNVDPEGDGKLDELLEWFEQQQKEGNIGDNSDDEDSAKGKLEELLEWFKQQQENGNIGSGDDDDDTSDRLNELLDWFKEQKEKGNIGDSASGDGEDDGTKGKLDEIIEWYEKVKGGSGDDEDSHLTEEKFNELYEWYESVLENGLGVKITDVDDDFIVEEMTLSESDLDMDEFDFTNRIFTKDQFYKLLEDYPTILDNTEEDSDDADGFRVHEMVIRDAEDLNTDDDWLFERIFTKEQFYTMLEDYPIILDNSEDKGADEDFHVHEMVIGDVEGDLDDEAIQVYSKKEIDAMFAAIPKTWIGTSEEYTAISPKDPNTIYYIIEG